ncbi:LytTR family DNA-binding domain-containing protein [Litorisediminicola beolgyonensis]|uniref:LytTR family DNA-binding domain-containing protein n=1 Tax=Litorisediminicola beolgyonensis TaxID=1173614 RepID=A0ABW3ZG62_9RHOB
MREIDIYIDWFRKFVIYIALLGFAVLMGPFGTYATLDPWDRVIFWTVDIIVVAFFTHLALHGIYKAPAVSHITPPTRFGMSVALGSIPAAGVIGFIYNVMAPEIADEVYFPALWSEAMIFSILLASIEFILWPQVVGRPKGRAEPPLFIPHDRVPRMPAPAEGVIEMAPAATVEAPEPVIEESAPQASRLAQRLPHELRDAEIMSVSMQDHYAEITTTAGAHLILMRMADALDLLDDTPGAQVHRSHWAATAHAQTLRRDGRKYELEMSDGRVLPVSGSYLDAARDLVGE